MTKRPKTLPLSIRRQHVAIACWTDLLGYGEMIADASYNPSHSKARDALARLRRFHRIVAEHSAPTFSTFTVNDGVVAYRDLTSGGADRTHDFLGRAWAMHRAILHDEDEHDLPGPRTVVAVGYRMTGRRRGGDTMRTKVDDVFDRMNAGEITQDEAKDELMRARIHSDVVPQLQANFAFSKAYVVESYGEKGGLPKRDSAFYLERDLINGPTPDWLELGPEFRWVNERLKLDLFFVEVRRIRRAGRLQQPPFGLRDSHELQFVLPFDGRKRRAFAERMRKLRKKGVSPVPGSTGPAEPRPRGPVRRLRLPRPRPAPSSRRP